MSALNVDLVFYHGNGCRDGFAAAHVLYTHLPPNVRYLEATPDNWAAVQLTIEAHDQPRVLFIDTCPPVDALASLGVVARHVLVADHHERPGAVEAASTLPNVTVILDKTRSGAGLACQLLGIEPTTLCRYVEDRDLWRWELPNSRAVNAYIRQFPLDFSVWDELAMDLDEQCNHVVATGRAILLEQAKYIEGAAARASRMLLGERSVWGVWAEKHFSEIGEKLLESHPHMPFVVVVEKRRRDIRYHLRSREFDVSKVAREYGGGGHVRAAGFRVERCGRQPLTQVCEGCGGDGQTEYYKLAADGVADAISCRDCGGTGLAPTSS